MLVSFALDPSALPSGADDPTTYAMHVRMIRTWELVGVLTYPGEKFDSCEIGEAIRSLPQNSRKLWKEAIKVNRRQAGPGAWRGIASIRGPEELECLRGVVEAVVVGDGRSEQFGLRSTELWHDMGSLFVGRYAAHELIPPFEKAGEMCREDIPPGVPVEDIWRSRFRPLATHSRAIAVVDRFAGSEFWEKRKGSGLAHLLRSLSEIDGINEMEIFVPAQDKRWNESLVDSISEFLRCECSGNGPRNIDLYFCNETTMKIFAHGRWLRFDRSVCQVDVGVQLLSEKTTWRNFQFNVKPLSQVVRNQESELRAHSSRVNLRARQVPADNESP